MANKEFYMKVTARAQMPAIGTAQLVGRGLANAFVVSDGPLHQEFTRSLDYSFGSIVILDRNSKDIPGGKSFEVEGMTRAGYTLISTQGIAKSSNSFLIPTNAPKPYSTMYVFNRLAATERDCLSKSGDAICKTVILLKPPNFITELMKKLW